MKATHIFHFGEKSDNNKKQFPNGVPVFAAYVDEDGWTEWQGDNEGNCVGFTQGYLPNEFGSYVVEISE